MLFGQLVFGPPGSGKTTYCGGMAAFLAALNRPTAVINLDPANDHVPYAAAVDIRQLVTLEAVMGAEGLGPNGGFIFCMEYLESNLDWLEVEIAKLGDRYLLIDCPGQVELYTLHDSFKRIVEFLAKRCDAQLCAVNLVDSLCCCDPHNFLSALLVSLSSMLRLELPHVNLLSKADLLRLYRPAMDFDIDFYTEVQDLSYLVERTSGAEGHRLGALNRCIAEVVEEFGLVAFLPLDIQDKFSVAAALKAIDRANGFALHGGGPEASEGGVWGPTAEILRDAYEGAARGPG